MKRSVRERERKKKWEKVGGQKRNKKRVENVKWDAGVFKEFATISQNSTINKEKCAAADSQKDDRQT